MHKISSWIGIETFSLLGSFMGTMQLAVEKHQEFFLVVDLMSSRNDHLARCVPWCNNGMIVIGLTNCFLTGYWVCSAEGNSYLVSQTWLRKYMWLGRSQSLKENQLLFFCYGVKLSSKICLYPWINAVLAFIIEAPFCSGGQLIQRITIGQSMENKCVCHAQP